MQSDLENGDHDAKQPPRPSRSCGASAASPGPMNALSKWRLAEHPVAFCFEFYNFPRTHKSLKFTPGMVAEITITFGVLAELLAETLCDRLTTSWGAWVV